MLGLRTITKTEQLRSDAPQVQARLHLIKARPKGKSVTSKDEKNIAWVRCVELVRDQQDERSFASLFGEFAPRIKGFLIKTGASGSLAEECAQDTMTIVWHKAHLFDASRASVATWIFTIARNKRIDAMRKINRPEPEELTWGPEQEPDAADVIALGQETKRLKAAIADLPEAQRTMVQKAFFGDLTHQEIAQETGLPMGTIKSRIRLALEKLRHDMK